MLRPVVVLIETYWNVNITVELVVAPSVSVLIETYWNVNITREVLPTETAIVLIETYWNVNLTTEKGVIIYKKRLNRNILECK